MIALAGPAAAQFQWDVTPVRLTPPTEPGDWQRRSITLLIADSGTYSESVIQYWFLDPGPIDFSHWEPGYVIGRCGMDDPVNDFLLRDNPDLHIPPYTYSTTADVEPLPISTHEVTNPAIIPTPSAAAALLLSPALMFVSRRRPSR